MTSGEKTPFVWRSTFDFAAILFDLYRQDAFAVEPDLSIGIMMTGVLVGIAGDTIFAVAVVTMRDSWRAGIAEEDNREMITSDIYKISRNPTAAMLHLQILQEEKYLSVAFGEEYMSYKKHACMYLGRKGLIGGE